MTTFDNILIARNDIANKIEGTIQALGLTEKETIFILESILNDTRMKYMTRESYAKASEEAKKEEEMKKQDVDKQEISEENK